MIGRYNLLFGWPIFKGYVSFRECIAVQTSFSKLGDINEIQLSMDHNLFLNIESLSRMESVTSKHFDQCTSQIFLNKTQGCAENGCNNIAIRIRMIRNDRKEKKQHHPTQLVT